MASPPEDELLELMRKQAVLLFVGSGLSNDLGYPLWTAYLAELEAALGESAPDGLDPLDRADWVKGAFEEGKRASEYLACLQRTFGPREAPQYSKLHTALLRLGFRGVVTTNYDPVLEHAMTAENPGGGPCTAVDLAEPRSYGVFDFLRRVSRSPTMTQVLHLHGTYDRPQYAVLARSDYERHYGDIQTYDSDGVPEQRSLDGIPRKVVWSLLVTYPTLFVGFSLDDPALRYILQTISADFDRGPYLEHFSIVGAESEEDEEKIRNLWSRHGITPIFYRVVRSETLGTDHSNLTTLVSGLGAKLGRDLNLNPIASFTQRMLRE